MSGARSKTHVRFVTDAEGDRQPAARVHQQRRRCHDLIIRRLRCNNCRKIHHELPDILVPYKRHESESIEAAVNGDDHCVAADESTISSWRIWFRRWPTTSWVAWRQSPSGMTWVLWSRFPTCPKSALLGIWHYVGDAPGWLARVVRSVANSNLWLHTRSAFCP